jgi:hypothetical protein
MPQLVSAEAEDVVYSGVRAPEVQRLIELALPAEDSGGELVGQAPVALGKTGEVAIARISQRCTGAHGAENVEGRATRGGS